MTFKSNIFNMASNTANQQYINFNLETTTVKIIIAILN